MNMDPMTMQNMMMNGGFGGAGMGMGMNGMNMGMGMGNFDSGLGAGFNNGWNPQQSWNVGPDNFNHPNAAGMGPGDYGANNSGFPQNAAGFNQGNYGRANQYNDQNSYLQAFQGRGRGRGRGGWHQNRGGHGHGFNDHSQHLQQQSGQAQQSSESHIENGLMSAGPKKETDTGTAANVDEFGRELRQDASKNEAENGVDNIMTQTPAPSAVKDGGERQVNPSDVAQDGLSGTGNDDSTPQPIQSLEAIESAAFAPMPIIGNGFNPMSPVDPNIRFLGHQRGGFSQSRGGRGGSFSAMQPPFVKPVDVPINAPTGPKAMREGPKSALPDIKTRGFSIMGTGSASARGSVNVAPESAIQERGRSRSPSQDKEKKDRSRSSSKSKDQKRDRSRERRHRRRHRSASRSRSEDEAEIERRREKRRERRRRHEEEAELERDKVDKRGDDNRKREDGNRSRSASPQDSKRSSHRSSRRDRDKYRDRERDDDKHRSSSRKHRSSHRSHRDDRSRSRERERSDRDREREHRHRQSRHASRDLEDRAKDETPLQTPTEPSRSSRKSSLISNGLGIEIKGASSRNRSTKEISLPLNIPTGPKGSQQDQERHRDRERDKSRSSRYNESHRSRRDSERNTISRDQEKERPEKKREEVDPHTLEREARDRERLLKEAQRIAGLTGAFGMGRKRSRDEVDDGSGRKGRKKGRKSGGEESDEARIARLEAERESSRWA